MSRAETLVKCRCVLKCGPETTRDLAMMCNTSRALIVVALHGDHEISRNGDLWTLTPKMVVIGESSEHPPTKKLNPRVQNPVIIFLHKNPGWHTPIDIATACNCSYATVLGALNNYRTHIKSKLDAHRRKVVQWEGEVCA